MLYTAWELTHILLRLIDIDPDVGTVCKVRHNDFPVVYLRFEETGMGIPALDGPNSSPTAGPNYTNDGRREGRLLAAEKPPS